MTRCGEQAADRKGKTVPNAEGTETQRHGENKKRRLALKQEGLEAPNGASQRYKMADALVVGAGLAPPSIAPGEKRRQAAALQKNAGWKPALQNEKAPTKVGAHFSTALILLEFTESVKKKIGNGPEWRKGLAGKIR